MWENLSPADVGCHLATISLADDESLIGRIWQAQSKIDRLVKSYLMQAFESFGFHFCAQPRVAGLKLRPARSPVRRARTRPGQQGPIQWWSVNSRKRRTCL